jgi:predicted N-acetyltransferase YhbS
MLASLFPRHRIKPVILRCERVARASKDARPRPSPVKGRACARPPQGDGSKEGTLEVTTIRHERLSDIDAREAILDQAFGEERTRKSSERLREQRLPAEGLAFTALDDRRVVGTARLWNISVGNGKPALLLGPVAVVCDAQGRGIGAALVKRAVREARSRGHASILLVGDAAYYGRFGFSAEKTAALIMPGPYEPHRLIALELQPGALDGARGMIVATGRPQPNLTLLAAQSRGQRRNRPRAA